MWPQLKRWRSDNDHHNRVSQRSRFARDPAGWICLLKDKLSNLVDLTRHSGYPGCVSVHAAKQELDIRSKAAPQRFAKLVTPRKPNHG